MNEVVTLRAQVSLLHRFGVNKATTRQTSHVNDFVNAKSHAREKTLLAGKKGLVSKETVAESETQKFGFIDIV